MYQVYKITEARLTVVWYLLDPQEQQAVGDSMEEVEADDNCYKSEEGTEAVADWDNIEAEVDTGVAEELGMIVDGIVAGTGNHFDLKLKLEMLSSQDNLLWTFF